MQDISESYPFTVTKQRKANYLIIMSLLGSEMAVT